MTLLFFMIMLWPVSLVGMGLCIAHDLYSTYKEIKQDIENEQLDIEVSNLLNRK